MLKIRKNSILELEIRRIKIANDFNNLKTKSVLKIRKNSILELEIR